MNLHQHSCQNLTSCKYSTIFEYKTYSCMNIQSLKVTTNIQYLQLSVTYVHNSLERLHFDLTMCVHTHSFSLSLHYITCLCFTHMVLLKQPACPPHWQPLRKGQRHFSKIIFRCSSNSVFNNVISFK